jgi:plasmid stability protein
MTIIPGNLEPEVIEKLQNLAHSHGRSLTEEIKVILVVVCQV